MDKNTTVLLIEDDRDYRTLLSIRLKKLELNVLVAEDVIEAFTILSNHPGVDIIVTDFQLSGTSGAELVAALRESNYHMPVVLISAVRAFKHDELTELGIAAFLEKPFSAEILKTTLERILTADKHKPA